MLTATEARKASVHGTFRNPSTKRSEVVKPTSKKPPTISQNQGMKILSLDAGRTFVTFPCHGEAADHRQPDCALALHRIHDGAAGRDSGRCQRNGELAARRDGGLRSRGGTVPDPLHLA